MKKRQERKRRAHRLERNRLLVEKSEHLWFVHRRVKPNERMWQAKRRIRRYRQDTKLTTFINMLVMPLIGRALGKDQSGLIEFWESWMGLVGPQFRQFAPKGLEAEFSKPIDDFSSWLRYQSQPPKKRGERRDAEPIKHLKAVIAEIYQALRQLGIKPDDALERIRSACEENGLQTFAKMYITSTGTITKWKDNDNDRARDIVNVAASVYQKEHETEADKAKLISGLAKFIVALPVAFCGRSAKEFFKWEGAKGNLDSA